MHTCRELSRISSIYQPHCWKLLDSRWWLVQVQVSYGYSNGYVVALCSYQYDSNCLRGSLSKSKCIQVIWRGIFPKLSWPECSSVTFHYEKLDESIGCWAELDRYVTIESVVRNDVMEGADGGRCPPIVLWDWGGWGAMMTDDLLFSAKKMPHWPRRSLSIRQECRASNRAYHSNSWTPGTRSSGDRFECATFIHNFPNISPFQYVYKQLN